MNVLLTWVVIVRTWPKASSFFTLRFEDFYYGITPSLSAVRSNMVLTYLLHGAESFLRS